MAVQIEVGAPIDDEVFLQVWVQRYDVLYKSEVQLRYHKYRQRFVDRLDKSVSALTILLGASLFGDLFNTQLPWVAGTISALGSVALVFGLNDSKHLHKELSEKSSHLVAAIKGVPPEALSATLVAKWHSEFALLCGKAPPPLKTLCQICEWEQSVAEGKANGSLRPPLHRRLTSDFIA